MIVIFLASCLLISVFILPLYRLLGDDIFPDELHHDIIAD
jgi:hypothetical protein